MEDKIIKVRCVDTDNYNYLTLDKEYECENIGRILTTIKDDANNFKHYPSNLFEKVEDVLMVKCIDNAQLDECILTEGKLYKVIEKGKNTYTVINDDNNKGKYNKIRFKQIAESQNKRIEELEHECKQYRELSDARGQNNKKFAEENEKLKAQVENELGRNRILNEKLDKTRKTTISNNYEAELNSLRCQYEEAQYHINKLEEREKETKEKLENYKILKKLMKVLIENL